MFRGVDFTGTDWGERNIDIAARLGVEPGLIAAARRHFDMVTHPHPDWSDVDFSRPLADIAAELGVSTASVSKAKRAMGLQRERIDWSGADWSKSDMELAEEYGCTTPSVWYARRVHGGGQATARKLGRTRLERVGENGKAQSPEQTREEWMKGRSKRTISVLFTQAGFDALAEAAERTGKTKTSIIREAVEAWIMSNK